MADKELKPLIAITVDAKHDPEDARTRGKLQVNWNYAQAIADAGGVPLLIPPQADMDTVAATVHGWLIPGGNDIDASNFGEVNHPMVTPIEAERFSAELRLFRSIDREMPVFGICYGCQFLNVARGGSLVQHLPDVTPTVHTDGSLQSYNLDANSQIANIAQVTRMTGQSWHHQAVDRVGENLKVSSHHQDGTVEAIEAQDRPWLIGVQWHPERTPADAATKRVFSAFIEAAKAYMESK